MKKKILCSFLALLVINLSIPHVAWAAEPTTSGNCGPSNNESSVTWELDIDSGTLTIKGTGKMGDYDDDSQPWDSVIGKIQSVVIENGVTSIGNWAFCECGKLTSVIIPESVTSIGSSAFIRCIRLNSVSIPDHISSISDFAFADCSNLESVTISANVTSIEECAFYGCSSLTSVTIPESVTSIGENAFMECSKLNAFFYKDRLAIADAKVPEETVKIAYTVNKAQNTPGKTEVTLVSTTKEVTIPCNAMGEGYKITANNTADKDNKVTITHNFYEKIVESTSDNLGGTEHKCTNCEHKYWTDFTRDKAYNQTAMSDGETIYHYCNHNGLAAETTVDVGDGQTLNVFLQDPLQVLKKNDNQVLGIAVEYVPEGSARYKELMRQVDGRHPIEHIKFFNVHPTVNGIPITGELDNSIYMEYEIPYGWNERDLEIILVKDDDDQEFIEKVLRDRR